MTPAAPPAVVERVRDRLRAERIDTSRDASAALSIARDEVRRHNDFALARGVAPIDDEAACVRDVLARRHDRVILVGNRVRDAGAWSGVGALSVPDSRLGALLVERGRRPPGAMGAAFAELAARVLPPPGSA